MPIGEAKRGWDSGFERFRSVPADEVLASLRDFIPDAGDAQLRAWKDSVPKLQCEVGEALDRATALADDVAVLEYELPLESRRVDAVFLVWGSVVVLELKGKEEPSRADLDQAAGYVRDLRCYHRECEHRPVFGVLVPTRSRGYRGEVDGIHVCGIDALDELIARLRGPTQVERVRVESFLSEDAYRPLPSLVQAARELFEKGTLRRIKRAAAATEPALDCIREVAVEAARTRTRRLVLVSGVPGSGKTLVGLQVAHARYLDELAVERAGGKPSAPAVFLSGNASLVEVLQYELRAAGGGGRTFVRDVKNYVKQYSRPTSPPPSEHVLIFDEAQRAWDAAQVAAKHPGETRSEPELFVRFAERIPEWCVIVGLIGGGQEIHVGEEAGIVQWHRAIEGAEEPQRWEVHGPPGMAPVFAGRGIVWKDARELNLETELRFHLARDVHRWVQGILDGVEPRESRRIADSLDAGGYHLRLSRDLDLASDYLRDRFSGAPHARYGIVASSRDRDLVRFRVYNDFQSTKRIRVGPWFASRAGEGRLGMSCLDLSSCVTEFGCQGLELDAALVAWGTDFVRSSDAWSIARARGYAARGEVRVQDPFRLRVNAYRVLLTRGRSGTVVFVPRLPELDATAEFLQASGVRAI